MFALALATGAPIVEAFSCAGYKKRKCAAAMARRDDVVTRVAEIKIERAGGGSRDVGPLIDTCMKAIEAAMALGTASGLVAARGLIAEAAKLKQMLPPDRALPDPQIRDLTDEEWTAIYGPKA